MARIASERLRATISSMADDLTLIKGIGPAIAARLRNTGILTFAQLTKFTPEDLSTRVSGLSAKRITREKWIKQAQKIASKTTATISHNSKTSRESQQHYATFAVELLLSKDNTVRRTRVTYIQSKHEKSWAGWIEFNLVNFINECTGLNLPLREESLPPARNSEVSSRERIPKSKIRYDLDGVLRVGELITTSIDSDLPQLLVRANEAFRVHFLLDLTEVKSSPSTFLNCKVTIWAKKLGIGARQIIGERQSTFMLVDKVPFVVESTIPSQGTFRLEAVATLSPASTSSSPNSMIRAWQEGRLLRVV